MSDSDNLVPERERELGRRDWLMIYSPMAIGTVLALSLVIAIAVLGFQRGNLSGDPASVWGDAAAIIVLVEVTVMLVVVLALTVALCALFFWLYVNIHPPLRAGQELSGRIALQADSVASRLVEVFAKPSLIIARVRAVLDFIRRQNVR